MNKRHNIESLKQLLEEAEMYIDGIQLGEIIELFIHREGYARFN